MPPGLLANSYLQHTTGNWVESVAVANRMRMLEEELKQLKSSGGTSSSQGPSYAELQKELTKTKAQPEAERKKSADQAYMLSQFEKQVKIFDHKIELATTRKNRAIADLDAKNVEARALEQWVKELPDLLDAEKKGRSAEVIALKDEMKALQKALEASCAAFKEYQEAEPSRFAVMRQNYIRSDEFV